MTLCEHHFSIESVVSLTNLGRLADRAALAAYQAESGTLKDDARDALMQAREPLTQLRDFSGKTIPSHASLQSMPPITVLEEIFHAVSKIDDQCDFGVLLDRLIEAIKAVADASATDAQIQSVKSFFDGLAEATLSRTTELARRRPDQRLRWMNQPSRSRAICSARSTASMR